MVQRIGKNGIVQQPQAQRPAPKARESFGSILQKVSKGLKVSAHAQERIHSRNIPFGSIEMARMENAVKKAQAKGCRDSLVMLDRNAFVVSIRNRTIVTAMDGMNVKENVFTKIDSAVVA